MSVFDGEEEDRFMVADEPELRSGKGGRKSELGSGLNWLGFVADEMKLGQRARIFRLFVFRRSEVEVVAALANALGGVGPEGGQLSIEISNRVVCCSASVETHLVEMGDL